MTTIDNTSLKEYLGIVVAYIIETRIRMNRPPYMALMSNIRNVVAQGLEASLKELTEEGLFTEHSTLNERAFEFTPPKDTLKQ